MNDPKCAGKASGQRRWSEIRRGPPASWNRVAGDDRELHYFTRVDQPGWWHQARCGRGPAVGKSGSDSGLGICTTCLPVEPEDLEDVEGIHVRG